MDISVTSMDVNQCDSRPELSESSGEPSGAEQSLIVDHFMGTHKCDNGSSRVRRNRRSIRMNDPTVSPSDDN